MVEKRKPRSNVLLNMDDPLLRNISGIQYFSTQSLCCQVRAEDVSIGAHHIKFTANYEGFVTIGGPTCSQTLVEAHDGPFGRQHVENILVGVSIAKFFGIIEDKLEIPPEIFSKKMVIEDLSGPLILNRSPAINSKVVATSICDYLEVLPPVRLEIGGRLKTSCGSADLERISQVINSSPFKEVVLFGELGEALRPLITKKVEESFGEPEVPTLRLERG